MFAEFGANNVDTIMDFDGTNQIWLDDVVFTAFGAGDLRGLDASTLRMGAGVTTAADANDYLICNTTTGALYYDADGSGALAATQFGVVANVSNFLTATNFILV